MGSKNPRSPRRSRGRLAPGSLGLGSPSPAGPGGGAALPSVITSRHSSHTRNTHDLRVYTIVTSKVDFTDPASRSAVGRNSDGDCDRAVDPRTSLHFSRESSEHRGSPRAASRPRARPGSGASTLPRGRTPLYDRQAFMQASLTGAAWTAYRSSTHKRAESILSNLWH